MPLDELNNLKLTNPADPGANPAEWPPLDRSLLGEARPAPPPFPLHLLPGRWRAWVEAASRPFGSADYLAHGLLGAVAGVCGAGLRIAVAPHWHEPLILWQALVGGPSSGKSATFARLRGLLASVTPWPESQDRGAPNVLVDADLNQTDTGLYSSSRGVVLWREDLADWMDEASRRAPRPAWLAAWEAAPGMVVRVPQECLAVGLMGALSPERLALQANARGFVDGDRALAARFLYVWPEAARIGSLDGEAADDEGLVALLQRIADFAGHRESPGIVPLDAAARQRLEALMAELRARAGEADGVETEWIAKGVPTVVRLAGLLAMMQWAEEVETGASQDDGLPVGLPHIEAAYALWSDYYLPHAMAVLDRAGIAGCERAARRVARWLRRLRGAPGDLQISREDVRRQALCQTVDAEGAEDVLARLEAGGVLRRIEIRTTGRTRWRWHVNPEVRDPSRTSR